MNQEYKKELMIFKAPWCKKCPKEFEINELKKTFNVKVFNLVDEENVKIANELNVVKLPTFIVDGKKYFDLRELEDYN